MAERLADAAADTAAAAGRSGVAMAGAARPKSTVHRPTSTKAGREGRMRI
jgi:hypothetical protein